MGPVMPPILEVNPYGVKAGQVWRECDKRMNGRMFIVQEIDGTRAVCKGQSGRVVRIRLNRFKVGSTGYKLVEG